MASLNHKTWCFALATALLLSAISSAYQQREAQPLLKSQVSGDFASSNAARQLRQFIGDGLDTAPRCEAYATGYCTQENACLPGSYSLDNATYCACCRPRSGVDPRAYTCGFVNCNENTWGEAVALPASPQLPPPTCIGKWMKCNACPNGTYSPPGSDSRYDCKSFSATAPTCYRLKNFSNPDVQPFPGMYFWPLNYTALNLQRLDTGVCAEHGLPVQVCLGSNRWSGPTAMVYQVWFILEDGTRLSPYANATAGTIRANGLTGFMQTSNTTCKWAQRNSLFYKDGPNFEIYGTEQCTSTTTVTGITFNTRRFKFVAPTQPHCTPSLVPV